MLKPRGVNHKFFIAFSFALGLLLSGCDSKNSSPAASTQPTSSTAAPTSGAAPALPHPCKLLTNDEAESILGEPVREPEAGSLGGNRICDYRSIKLHGGIAPYSIHIALSPEKRESWDADKKLHLDSNEARPVSGIGEDAYFLLDDLQIYAKQLSVNINVMKNIDRPDHAKAVQEAERSVAQKVTGRL
jgi:hypothetical protein